MTSRLTFQSLAERAETERLRLASAEWPGYDGRQMRELAFEEIRSSVALADARLGIDEIVALVERGVALGDHRFSDLVLTSDYADAARYAAALVMPKPSGPYLRLEEIVELHARVTRRANASVPGTWRQASLPPFPSGMMVTPPWLIPNELAAFVHAASAGPPHGSSALLWIATLHERFERLHPFPQANGRVGRLIVNLLLRRCGFPPFAVRERDAERYLEALRSADSRDIWPLATMIARSVLASLQRLSANDGPDPLGSFASFVTGAKLEALYKAAQRGRLRTVRRNGSLLTTQAWIDSYDASRPTQGRR